MEDDQQLLRYSRQIMLPQVGIEGQERLAAAHALVVGVGGLGSPVAMYLAAAGIGHLTLVDGDRVELTNLQRQIAHDTDDLGRPKVDSARERLHALNPEVDVRGVPQRVGEEALYELSAAADVVVDASDNFDTRFAVNRACARSGRPLVSGAAIRMEGQVAVYRLDRGTGPCYRCLYREQGELPGTCSENGVLAPVVGVIGSLQAVETIKLILGLADSLETRLWLYDGLNADWRQVKLKADPQCPVCAELRVDV